MTDKFDQALNEMETTLKPFMPVKQAQILIENLHRSEEAEAFADIILNLAERIKAMPQVYETNISEQKKVNKNTQIQKKVAPKKSPLSEKKRKSSTEKQNIQKRKEAPTVKKATEEDVLDFFDL